jgi:hypothetical protein
MLWEMFKEDFKLLSMLVEFHILFKEKLSRIFQKELIPTPSEFLLESQQELQLLISQP